MRFKIVLTTIFIFIIFLFIVFGCKKKETNEKPEINISSPIENSSYQVLDTIIVSFEVRDDNEVISVEINLVDENFTLVDESVLIQVNLNQKVISLEYIPKNLDLLTGVYYIEIKAYDDDQDSREYLKINLAEYPLSWEGLLVVHENGTVGKIDVGYQFLELWNLPEPYRHGDVDNRNHNLYVGNDNSGKIAAHDMENGMLKWVGSVSGSPSADYFNDLFYNANEQMIVYSSEEHEIRRFTSNGVEQASVLLGGDDNIEKVFEYDNHIYTEVKSIFESQSHFQIYFAPTGSLISDELFNGDIIEILSLNENELLILGNDENEEGFLNIYNIELNSFDNYSLFSETAKAMAIIGQQRIVVSLENSIYRYDFVTNQLVLLESEMSFDTMTYDPVNNIMYCAHGSVVYYYQTTPWTLLGQHNSLFDVKDIFNLYNK